jgi:peptidoglycan hydrolase-like protein with peptidoglycan-binding domain
MRRAMLAIRPGVWVAAVAMLVTGGILAAPATPAMAASGCVTQNFTTADQGVVLDCVKDAQVLLNNIRKDESPNLPNLLQVDGRYGPLTSGDVTQFQKDMNLLFGAGTLAVDGDLGPHTWGFLCSENSFFGFQGQFWHAAGCATD